MREIIAVLCPILIAARSAQSEPPTMRIIIRVADVWRVQAQFDKV